MGGDAPASASDIQVAYLNVVSNENFHLIHVERPWVSQHNKPQQHDSTWA